MFVRFFICQIALLALTATVIHAADINYISVGEGYYLYRLVGPNELVRVTQVDKRNNRVKVMLANGAVDWVRPGELMDQRTSDQADTQTRIIGAAAAIAALGCLLDPDACKEALSGETSDASGQSFGFKFKNNCKHPLALAIRYADAAGNWRTAGWWNVKPGQSSYLADVNNKRLTTKSSTWYYYAETTDKSNLVWKGQHVYDYGGEALPMARLDDKDGDSEWSTTCN